MKSKWVIINKSSVKNCYQITSVMPLTSGFILRCKEFNYQDDSGAVCQSESMVYIPKIDAYKEFDGLTEY